jgi:hypothetical protein
LQPANFNVGGEIEMRHRLLRERQPRGDSSADDRLQIAEAARLLKFSKSIQFYSCRILGTTDARAKPARDN